MNTSIRTKTVVIASVLFAVLFSVVNFAGVRADLIDSDGNVAFNTNDTIDSNGNGYVFFGPNDSIDPTPTVTFRPNDSIDPLPTNLPDGCGIVYGRKIVCGAPFSTPTIRPPHIPFYPTVIPTYTPTYTLVPRPTRTITPMPPIQVYPSVDLKVRAGNTSNFVDGTITIDQNVPFELSWNSNNVSTCNASGNWNGARGTVGALVIEAGLPAGQYLYTLTCTGIFGNATDFVRVNIRGPTITPTPTPNAPTVQLRANGSDQDITINYNQAVALSWTSTNASYCVASGDWSGTKSTQGSQTISNNIFRKVFLLTCYGQGGSASDIINVHVNNQVTPTPTPTTAPYLTVSLQPQPQSGYVPFASTLTATINSNTNGPITYKFDCTNDGIYEGIWTNISNTVWSFTCNYNQAGTYTARVIAERDGLTATDTRGITAYNQNNYQNTIVDLTTNRTSVNTGDSAILSWNSQNAQYCIASNGWYGSKATSGNEIVYNIFSTTTFVLTCYGNNSASDIVTISTNSNTNNGTVTLSKSVRNVSRSSGLGSSINAQPNDTLEFVITATNNSNSTANNVRVYDSLPYGLNYVNNSATQNGYSTNGEIVNNGAYINLSPNQTITFRFQATVSDSFILNYISSTITNVANASTNNGYVTSNTATIYVNKTAAVIDNTQTGTLSIQKFGKDISKGDATERSNLTAQPNDTIEFVLRVRTLTSSTIDNVYVRDIMPDGLIYVPRSTSINGISAADGIVGSSGLLIGSIGAGNEIIIRFNATVSAQSFQRANTSITNTAIAFVNQTNTSVQSGLPITINNPLYGGVISNPGNIQTGSGTLLIALLTGLVITTGYVFYNRSGYSQNRRLNRILKNSKAKTQFNFV